MATATSHRVRNLDPHPTAHPGTSGGIDPYDVFIAGSGPIGALFARQLVDAGHRVVMVEIGDQDTRVPAAHKKNEIAFQKDIDRFVRVIQGALSPVSVPVSSTVIPELDPSAWRPEPGKQILVNGRNSFQSGHNNLGAQAVTRGVGGMTTHWTCATPEFLKRDLHNQVFERPGIFDDVAKDDAEWKKLYDARRSIIGTSEKEFDHSIRHNVVLNALKESYKDRGVKALPLACHRLENNSPYVRWHAADNVFYDMFTKPEKKNREGRQRGAFLLLTNTRCTKLHLREDSRNVPSIWAAEVRDLLQARVADNNTHSSPGVDYYISAKTFIIASGAVATPQILANSLDFSGNAFGGRRTQPDNPAPLIPNLGRYITEQPMAFCQIVLRQNLVDDAGNTEGKPKWWKKAVEDHKKRNPADPLPFPFLDGEPQVTIPASYERPWHTQIHRDAFSYGEAGPRADPRWGLEEQDGDWKNRILFEDELTDAFGMPQPTFEYTPTPKFAIETSTMMNDMTDVANKLGGYLPGSYPQFMTPGLALHLGGTTRLGQKQSDSVGDYNSQVWKFDNLYVGGNGLIPTAFGANPTLTSMCLAIRAAHKIHLDLERNRFSPPNPDVSLEPTPEDWVRWTNDKNDPNFPDHVALRPPHTQV